MNLKAKTFSGVKWTTASTILVTIIQLLQLSILARLLAPSDFGLMAIVMVVIGFSQAFMDMGVSNAIIHKQAITQDQLSTLYWLNVLTGIVVFIVICALSPLMTIFYKEAELTRLTILVGLTFLIQPFGQQFLVLWQKEMRFVEMAKIDVVTKFLSLVVSVGFARAGYGVYSLVYGTLSAVILQTALLFILGVKEHRPRMIFRRGEIDEFISFGLYQMGERTVNYFGSQIDVILIGKLLGTEALGVYNVAKQLSMRPAQIINPIITKVTFPAMAKVQNDTVTLKRVYLKTINYLSSVNFLIYSIMIVLAPNLVFVMFGDKWILAVPIVQILSIYGALRSTGNPIGSLLLAKGKANLGFYWNLGLLLYIPTVIAIASKWGILGISWMLVFLSASLIIPSWFFLVKPLCGATFYEYHKPIITATLIAMLTIAIGHMLHNWFLSDFLTIGVELFALTTITGLCNYIWNREFGIELYNMIRPNQREQY